LYLSAVCQQETVAYGRGTTWILPGASRNFNPTTHGPKKVPAALDRGRLADVRAGHVHFAALDSSNVRSVYTRLAKEVATRPVLQAWWRCPSSPLSCC